MHLDDELLVVGFQISRVTEVKGPLYHRMVGFMMNAEYFYLLCALPGWVYFRADEWSAFQIFAKLNPPLLKVSLLKDTSAPPQEGIDSL